jgi:hypothetical protein
MGVGIECGMTSILGDGGRTVSMTGRGEYGGDESVEALDEGL